LKRAKDFLKSRVSFVECWEIAFFVGRSLKKVGEGLWGGGVSVRQWAVFQQEK